MDLLTLKPGRNQVIQMPKKCPNPIAPSAPTLRFEVNLKPGDGDYVELSYKQLVLASQSVQQPSSFSTDSNSCSFNFNCIGYDESDSFIDNTEPHDEVSPYLWNKGGFHVNKGKLDLLEKSEKKITADSKKAAAKNKTDRVGMKEPAVKPRKRKHPEVISTSTPFKNSKTESEGRIEIAPTYPTVENVPPVGREIEVIDLALDASSEDEIIELAKTNTEINTAALIVITPKLANLLQNVKMVAEEAGEGKRRIFSRRPHLGEMLVEIDAETQKMSSSERSVIYKHLSSILNFSVATLKSKVRRHLVMQAAVNNVINASNIEHIQVDL